MFGGGKGEWEGEYTRGVKVGVKNRERVRVGRRYIMKRTTKFKVQGSRFKVLDGRFITCEVGKMYGSHTVTHLFHIIFIQILKFV